MKKIYLLLAGMLLSASVIAQNTLTNSSFENWSSSILSVNQPEGWTTSIVGNITMPPLPMPIPVNVSFGTQSTDAHTGNSALNLQAHMVGIPNTSYNMMFPSIAQLGVAEGFNIPLSTIMSLVETIGTVLNGDTADFDFEDLDIESLMTLLQILAPGDAVSQTPAHLNMWVKFQPHGSDMLNVIAYSKQSGMPVGFAMYSSAEPMNEYTQISIPFDNALEPCDSLMVIILGGGVSSSDSTVLLVDDITIDFEPDGVNAMDRQQFSCYPNPTAGVFFIKPQGDEPYNYEVFDLEGRVVRADNNQTGVSQVSTNSLSKGVYFLKVYQNGQTYPQKIVVR